MHGSIFRTSLMLAIGGVLAAACASTIIIFFAPVPFHFPLSTLQVARALEGRTVEPPDDQVAVRLATQTPVLPAPQGDFEVMVRDTIARHLAVPPDRVRFAFHRRTSLLGNRPFDIAQAEYQRRAVVMYTSFRGDQRFSALLFGPFDAAIALPDGRWRVVASTRDAPGPQWQTGILKWIALALLFILPVTWWFSRRLTRPIRAFAVAADRIGRGEFTHVEVDGPAEVRTAAQALNDMQARVERQIHERTAVLGAVAHDLRTPLARLHFLLAPAPEPIRERTEAEIAGMDRMIATTLDFVRGETAAPMHEPLDLRLLIEGVVDDFADRGHPAVLDPGPNITLSGDPAMLCRLVTNLVSNAVEHGGGARARILHEGTRAVIEVDDDGPGMTAEQIARAFEPFYRAEPSRNRATGGMGLGLAIVRSIARAHGGDARLERRQPQGLRARVTLPA